jgi:hypothetical protein
MWEPDVTSKASTASREKIRFPRITIRSFADEGKYLSGKKSKIEEVLTPVLCYDAHTPTHGSTSSEARSRHP